MPRRFLFILSHCPFPAGWYGVVLPLHEKWRFRSPVSYGKHMETKKFHPVSAMETIVYVRFPRTDTRSRPVSRYFQSGFRRETRSFRKFMPGFRRQNSIFPHVSVMFPQRKPYHSTGIQVVSATEIWPFSINTSSLRNVNSSISVNKQEVSATETPSSTWYTGSFRNRNSFNLLVYRWFPQRKIDLSAFIHLVYATETQIILSIYKWFPQRKLNKLIGIQVVSAMETPLI